MTHTSAAPIELLQLGETSLYRPAMAGPGETMRFLRGSAVAPPARLSIDQVWSDRGAPRDPGDFVFFDRSPDDGEAAALERALRRRLVARSATGFAWAVLRGSGEDLDVHLAAHAEVALVGDVPSIGIDVALPVPNGMRALGFSAGAPLLARREAAGQIVGVVVTYPPRPGAAPPDGSGLALPLTGDGVGCVRFLGMVDGPGAARASDRAVKQLVDVSFDPLHPFDPKRSYQTFVGRAVVLVRDASRYHLESDDAR